MWKPNKPNVTNRRRQTAGLIRRLGQLLGKAVRLVLLGPLLLARFVGKQARGTVSNLSGFARWLSPERTLPPALASTLRWFGEKVPEALGGSSRRKQVVASGALMVVAITTSVITGGLTIAAVAILLVFAIGGLLRFIPAVNDGWVATRSKIRSRDGMSRPKWDRDRRR